MENITLGQIIGAIGVISVIGGFIVGLARFYKANFTDKFNLLNQRVEKLEEVTKRQELDIHESKEERLLLIKSQLACLKGLREQGCNGPVTEAITNIENYLIEKSH